jgi:hypothetical protein
VRHLDGAAGYHDVAGAVSDLDLPVGADHAAVCMTDFDTPIDQDRRTCAASDRAVKRLEYGAAKRQFLERSTSF